MKKSYDHNGAEIKIGARVRIIASECNKFVRRWFDESYVPELLSDKDEYGTAKIVDGFFQVVNEHDDMLWDLSSGGDEPELEVVDKSMLPA